MTLHRVHHPACTAHDVTHCVQPGCPCWCHERTTLGSAASSSTGRTLRDALARWLVLARQSGAAYLKHVRPTPSVVELQLLGAPTPAAEPKEATA